MHKQFIISLVLTVQCFQVLVVDHTGHYLVSKGQQHDDNDGKDHFDVGPGREAKEAHHAQLHHLTECEEVNLALWTPAYVVIWRVGGLFHKKQCDAFKHLIAIERSYCHVEEKAIEHGSRDISQWVGD